MQGRLGQSCLTEDRVKGIVNPASSELEHLRHGIGDEEFDQEMPFGLSLSNFMPRIILTSGQYDIT